MSNFHVGQRVVAISSAPWTCSKTGAVMPGPLKGEVSVIAAVFLDDGTMYLQLCNWGRLIDDIGFVANRFRPAVEPKTDISIFHRLADEAARTRTITVKEPEAA